LQADKVGYALSYDAKGIWSGLKFRARDGASIEYLKR